MWSQATAHEIGNRKIYTSDWTWEVKEKYKGLDDRLYLQRGLVVSHVRNRRDRAGGVSFWRPEC